MRIALLHMNSGDDVARNVDRADELLADAAGDGADLAALPETFTYMGSASRHAEVAEPVPGPTSERLAEAARRSGMWIHGGSLLERDGDRLFNTSLLFDRGGELVARYRKIHLFDVALPGQPPLRESATYTAGEEIVTAQTEFGRVGMSICYDLRFPELYRGLMARGAEILFVPAAFTYATGEGHWEVLLRARAIENQAFVVAANQWGTWGPPDANRRCWGRGMVIDPWGRVLACAEQDAWGVEPAEVDLAELRRVRETLPVLQHRRLGLMC